MPWIHMTCEYEEGPFLVWPFRRWVSSRQQDQNSLHGEGRTATIAECQLIRGTKVRAKLSKEETAGEIGSKECSWQRPQSNEQKTQGL